ncbi:MAG: serine esterase [Bdellovibrionaceae bacterium]|nr:serine esterase [Pseudobdellovibrionaceae bacterium]
MIETELFKSHFIPSARPSDKLMVVLHGKGDSLRAFKEFNAELELHDFNFLLLNAPKKFLDGYSWYGDPPFQKQGVLRIREKMFRLLDDLQEQGWRMDRTFLFGFSQGCLVSTDIALHYPKPLAGVVGVSGYFQFYPRWRQDIEPSAVNTPWLLTHGRKDDVLPIDDTKYGVEKLRSVGLKIEWLESDKEHTFEEEEYPVIRRWVRRQLSR